MITRTHQMNGKQIADLEQLMRNCINVDQNSIPIYKHLIDKRHTLACNTLYYLEDQLIGYLRTFFFYTTACEIALMVDPAHRRKGIASALLREILPIVSQEKMQNLIFSTPKNHNQQWFETLKFRYRNAEFQMQFDPQKPTLIPHKAMQIRLATLSDLETLVALDDICFPKKNPNATELFRSLFSTPNCAMFVLLEDNNIVGKAHIFKESDRARITDIGIFPDFRGQGRAGALIKHCIKHALINNKPKIMLDVEANNASALKLYESLGFHITNAHDYWETPDKTPEFGLSAFLHDKQEDSNLNKDAQ